MTASSSSAEAELMPLSSLLIVTRLSPSSSEGGDVDRALGDGVHNGVEGLGEFETDPLAFGFECQDVRGRHVDQITESGIARTSVKIKFACIGDPSG